jgi:hypothetical protein
MKHLGRTFTSVLSLAALAMLGTACATVAAATRPDELKAGDAIGGVARCSPEQVKKDSEPFVVDWSDDRRASLESAMSRGVAVVRYSCEGAEVLKGCSIRGDYGYVGISKKTSVIEMNDKGSVSANLGPAHIPASFEAEMAQGKSLNLAYMIVGEQSTTVQTVTRDMLVGRCDGATHFVYAASVGAFAMDTGAKGRAKVAAEVFKYGSAKAEGSSEKATKVTDGDAAACEGAKEGIGQKLPGCQALVRVTLFAVSDTASSTPKPIAGTVDNRSCQAGYVYADGQCKPAGEAKVFLCDKGNMAQCKELCDKGSVESCGRFSNTVLDKFLKPTDVIIASEQRPGLAKAVAGMSETLKKACDAGEAAACTVAALGIVSASSEDLYVTGALVAPYVSLMEKGCRGGEAYACSESRFTYGSGQFNDQHEYAVKADPEKLEAIVGMACDRGSAYACAAIAGEFAGERQMKARVPADQRAKRTLRYLDRACNGGLAGACAFAGAYRQEEGQCKATVEAISKGIPSKGSALSFLRDEDSPCSEWKGAADAGAAKSSFEQGCKGGFSAACALAK